MDSGFAALLALFIVVFLLLVYWYYQRNYATKSTFDVDKDLWQELWVDRDRILVDGKPEAGYDKIVAERCLPLVRHAHEVGDYYNKLVANARRCIRSHRDWSHKHADSVKRQKEWVRNKHAAMRR